MSSSEQAQEPTMEEILASIRRIIADDATEEAAPPEPETAEESTETVEEAAASEESEEADTVDPDFDFDALSIDDDDVAADAGTDEEDVLELTDVLEEEPAASEAQLDTELGDIDMVDLETGDVDTPSEDDGEVEFVPADIDFDEAAAPVTEPDKKLLSTDTDATVAAAFGTLASTLLARDGASRTLEDLVQELLRPMLKSWLDENLPSIVEELVRQEIERVARRSGR